jgi:hypothetical protein
MSDETLEKLRKGIEAQIDARVLHQTEETNPAITGIIQCYLLLQILDMLDNINEKIAMANINIQDVEQAILAQKEQNNHGQ